ncbi:hypothetical protein FRC12_008555 [Ceratobasidium sp. 428]|nr:hypothetical protein FRC12_008555 [Ceratobasidium sp. 428]
MDKPSDSAFSYHPPPEGDISLKSSDGVVFLAHSLLLRLASSVFADMFSTATQKDVVELSDDSESVSLMLRFIYPPVFMDDLPIELLEKSLHIGQKYDVSGIATSVDHILVSRMRTKDSFICSSPIHAFCLAGRYGLPKTRQATAEALRPGCFSFNDTKDVLLLAQGHATAAGPIGLLGAHCIRIQRLADVLFRNRQGVIFPSTIENDYPEGRIMMCRRCFDETGYDFEVSKVYVPSWVVQWTITAFCDLTSRPSNECNHLFEFSILDTISSEPHVCPGCISAAHSALDGNLFRVWAKEARHRVNETLREVECLYNF